MITSICPTFQFVNNCKDIMAMKFLVAIETKNLFYLNPCLFFLRMT